jgi:hypothetical protein
MANFAENKSKVLGLIACVQAAGAAVAIPAAVFSNLKNAGNELALCTRALRIFVEPPNGHRDRRPTPFATTLLV